MLRPLARKYGDWRGLEGAFAVPGVATADALAEGRAEEFGRDRA